MESGRDKIEYLPQYAEGIFEQIPAREEDGVFNFMFAGNIGAVQSVETVIKAARMMEGQPVKFHIVGGGTDLERLQKMSEDLDNVIFYGKKTAGRNAWSSMQRRMRCLLLWPLTRY